MIQGCDVENNRDIKEGLVQVAKEQCSISQKLIFNSKRSFKSNTQYITELAKVKISNTSNVIIAILNRNSLVLKFDELKDTLMQI